MKPSWAVGGVGFVVVVFCWSMSDFAIGWVCVV